MFVLRARTVSVLAAMMCASACTATEESDVGADAAARDTPVAPDAPSEDTPPAMDVRLDAPDGGTSDATDAGADAFAPSCMDGGPIDLVAACEAAATDMSTRCGGGSDRECEWLAIREFCSTERADVLLADMRCTAAFSSEPGGTGCRSFGDPSGARDCIIDSHACFEVTEARTVADRVGAAFTSLCGSPAGASALNQGVIPFAALSSATLAEIDGCLPAADCDSLRACVLAPFATIFACFP